MHFTGKTSPPTPPGRLCNELEHTWLASRKVEDNQTKNVNQIIVSVHSADAEPVIFFAKTPFSWLLIWKCQPFPRVTSIGSLPPKNLGKSRAPPQNPAETPQNPRRGPAEPSERPPQSPLRGKFPRRASRRVVPLGWWPSGTLKEISDTLHNRLGFPNAQFINLWSGFSSSSKAEPLSTLAKPAPLPKTRVSRALRARNLQEFEKTQSPSRVRRVRLRDREESENSASD